MKTSESFSISNLMKESSQNKEVSSPDKEEGGPNKEAGGPNEEVGSPDKEADSPDKEAGSPDKEEGDSDKEADGPDKEPGGPDYEAGWNKAFSHVYVETGVLEHPKTQRILSKLAGSKVIEIGHYKDVFNRSGQNFKIQKNSPKLVIARRTKDFCPLGSPMCDSFGNSRFYASSQMMNCMLDCDYCYLQGMYSSANVVAFANIEDTFAEAERLLPAYICVSYDTDLLAFEGLTGFVSDWLRFCESHPGALIEIRTKAGSFSALGSRRPQENVILAWSLAPDPLIKRFERRAPSLGYRLQQMRKALEAGWRVRLRFEPVIQASNWRELYKEAALQAKIALGPYWGNLEDAGASAFRAPEGHFKRMRKMNKSSEVYAWPMIEADEETGGVVHKVARYSNDEEVTRTVERFLGL
ncbi:MAG: radical SAM protein [Clostridiales bacterium]|jgi:spore photoproduct lyase|nr:radical SAM protein [Clostridiales bacterium]